MQFYLKPFYKKSNVITSVEVEALREGSSLSCRHQINGNIEAVRFQTHEAPDRKDEIWKGTCVELFLSLSNGRYLEGNLSLSGQWNLYSFEEYRKGMTNAPGEWRLNDIVVHPERITMKSKFVWKDSSFDDFTRIGVSSIIEDKDGNKEYWGISHPSGEPDFHDASTFIAWSKSDD